ncbi:MAG TPA: hypothetical protein VF844_17745 [Ktedonobacteraceae bacterium]
MRGGDACVALPLVDRAVGWERLRRPAPGGPWYVILVFFPPQPLYEIGDMKDAEPVPVGLYQA